MAFVTESAIDGTQAPDQTATMFTFGGAGGAHGVDPLILILFAMLIEAYVGEARMVFSRLRHPVAIIGGLVEALDRKLNRETRSAGDRAVRGLLVVLIIGGGAGTVGWAVAWLTINHDFGWIVEIVLLSVLMAQRGLFDRVRAVGVALKGGGLEQARQAVGHIVGRDPQQLDEHGVARGAIESAAENFCDAVVAPVFWYVLFGLPGLMVQKAVNTMDSMIGFTTPRHRAFGMAAARLDDALNFFPARISGVVIALAALFVPTANVGRAFKVMLSDAGKHRSLNAGWPEGAMAGALDLALGGPRSDQGRVAPDPWIGDGRARANHRDIRRALYMFTVACLINAGLVAGLILLHLST